MSASIAVSANELTKSFRIYSERNQTLKQVVLRRRRAVYEEFLAVDRVSFEIPSGSTFGIIGSNGSGKSTTLKVLAKILEPDAGSVEVSGRISALLELGAGFHPELSGRENVFLNAAILGIPRNHVVGSFDSIVDFAGLGRFIDNPVKTYSSGMYARLGFAVAVNVDPDVLLLDEVLAVGDESFQRRCAEKIDELRGEGRTVVLVSHGLGSVQSLCDRAVWIEKGILRAEGKPGEVIEQYVRSVHPDSVVDDLGRVRIGSGEARIDEVRLVSGIAQTGRPLEIELAWTAHEHLPAIHMTVVLRRSDGLRVGSSSSTTSAPDGIEMRAGAGTARVEFANMPLLPGSYDVEVEITDLHRAHVLDRLTHSLRLDLSGPVTPSDPQEVVSLPAQWSVNR